MRSFVEENSWGKKISPKVGDALVIPPLDTQKAARVYRETF